MHPHATISRPLHRARILGRRTPWPAPAHCSRFRSCCLEKQSSVSKPGCTSLIAEIERDGRDKRAPVQQPCRQKETRNHSQQSIKSGQIQPPQESLVRLKREENSSSTARLGGGGGPKASGLHEKRANGSPPFWGARPDGLGRFSCNPGTPGG